METQTIVSLALATYKPIYVCKTSHKPALLAKTAICAREHKAAPISAMQTAPAWAGVMSIATT
jgi:hypothetical protein